MEVMEGEREVRNVVITNNSKNKKNNHPTFKSSLSYDIVFKQGEFYKLT